MDAGFLAFRSSSDLASCLDEHFSEATAAVVGRLRVLGFRPLPTVQGVFGDPKARVITLKRRSEKRSAATAVECTRAGTTAARSAFAQTSWAEDPKTAEITHSIP